MTAKTEFGQWIIDAKKSGWSNIGFFCQNAKAVHGDMTAGFWRCAACEAPVVDCCISGGCFGEAVLLTSADGIGSSVLCEECYDAAKAARAKIVVREIDDDDDAPAHFDQDDSDLTDEERELASYLDDANTGQAGQSRDLIADYPRDRRRDLHRYQDQIDLGKWLSGKRRY